MDTSAPEPLDNIMAAAARVLTAPKPEEQASEAIANAVEKPDWYFELI